LVVSIDFPVLSEISEHPECFYASNVIGLSMYPHAYTGDTFIIQTKDHPDFNIEIGDILIYTNGEHVVGHRVIGITSNYFVVKGDANPVCEIVYPNQIIGKVFKTISRYNPIGQFVFQRWLDKT